MYDEDEYDDYPQQPRRLRRPRRTLHWKWLAAAVIALCLVSLRFCTRSPNTPRKQPPRTQVVTTVNWQEVDARIRLAVEDAHAKARQHAEIAVRLWTRQLRERIDNDYLPFWF
jgi:hypothetical protein